MKLSQILILAVVAVIPIPAVSVEPLFDGRIEYPAGGGSFMCAHDLNKDGAMDLVETNGFRVSILLNDGTGAFAFPVFYEAGKTPLCAVVEDLDDDGDPDLAVANYGYDSVSILFNDGLGAFSPATNYYAGGTQRSICAADFDGDGDPDLALADFQEDSITILSNNADGTFGSAVRYGVGDSPRSVATADFDGDGDYDLAVTNSLSGTVSILFNTGDGVFDSAVDFGVHIHASDIITCDLDNDDDIDLAVGCIYFGMSVLRNNGDGTFAAYEFYEVGGGGALCAADLDADGDNDLAVISQTLGQLSGLVILVNQGGGSFTPDADYPTGGGPSTVAGADFDRDGDIDLAVGKQMSGTIAILSNDGNGDFTSSFSPEYVAGCTPACVHANDLDGDGDNDLAVGNIGWDIGCEGSLSVILNEGDGIFAPSVQYSLNWCSAVSSADFDDDGDNDLAVLGDSVCVLANTGDGTFAPPYRSSPAGGTSMLSADFDGDNYTDLAVSLWNDSLAMLLNRGDGTFAGPAYYGVGDYPQNMCAADFDNDNDYDIAVVSYYSEAVSILLNYGDGTFPPADEYPVDSNLGAVLSADFDDDGDNDLAISATDAVYILSNDGNAAFSVSQKSIIGFHLSRGYCRQNITGGDFDGDGDYDLAISDGLGACVSVLLNNGQGTFGSQVNYAVGNTTRSLYAADLDGDGDLDLAATVDDGWFYSGGVTILFNLSDVPTDARDYVLPQIPNNLEVSQNYPNPFNPSTTIEFNVPRSSDVILAIFNIMGQKVTTLIDGRMTAGKHGIQWDGKDAAGNRVASGIYFYQISTDDYMESRKMLLLK